MPEGDTVATAALRLRPVLVGQGIEEAISRWPARCAGLSGRTIPAIRTRGKHLLLDLDDRTVVRVHLGMQGGWRVMAMRPGDLGTVSLALRTAAGWVVCRRAPVVERFDADVERLHPVLSELGPDLIEPGVDLEEVIARCLGRGGTLGEALVDQRVACGLGNIYKSELPFFFRLNPAVPVAAVDRETLRAVYAQGSRWLRENVGRRRCTVPPAPGRPLLWVYGRHRRPCLRCGRAILRAAAGTPPRGTWWCPSCQSRPSAVS